MVLSTDDAYVLGVSLFASAFLMFSTRGVNTVLMQVFMVPFLIVMFNLLFPGEWYLAIDRVIDVLIGGTIAVAVVSVMHETGRRRNSPGNNRVRG